jgi:hypothetical protein
MRAVIVSVDYADILAVTLPYNRHHFDDVVVVTSTTDEQTAAVVLAADCHIVRTDVFYESGAKFNKFAAIEQALDDIGRTGWLCLMDADILFPKVLPKIDWEVGNIYSPRRRMQPDITTPIPPESEWGAFQFGEPSSRHLFAGYTQIFHADDPVLQKRPWHRLNYDNASDGDTEFSKRWKGDKKIRPPFDVLHLGPDTTNWCGRASSYVDGTAHPDAQQRIAGVQEFLQKRKRKKVK